jgi:hypothetical protein
LLITTDDLYGVRHERILQLIDDIRKRTLTTAPVSEFSKHHYKLYI